MCVTTKLSNSLLLSAMITQIISNEHFLNNHVPRITVVCELAFIRTLLISLMI